MVAYLKLAQVLLKSFDKYNVVQVPRADNTYVDALTRLASTKKTDLLWLIPVEHLAQPSIMKEDIHEQETNKFATSELAPDNLGLPIKASLELAPYEKSQHGEVNLTQPPPQLNELILEVAVLQTLANVDGPSGQLFEGRGVTCKQERSTEHTLQIR